MSIHAITGGTGFVGMGIILELLQQTDVDLLCLVRPGQEDVTHRLYQRLFNAMRDYKCGEELVGQMKKRCHVLPLDLANPVPVVQSGAIEQFWHCAASLCFEDWHAEEIYAVNVEGTRLALDLARQWHARMFNHISSIAATGTLTGTLYEQHFFGQGTHNHYERSKMLAEALVAQASGFKTRIFRLDGIIGHSQTHAARGTEAGFYGFIRHMFALKQRFEEQGISSRSLVFHSLADPETPVDLLPVDHMARQLVTIASSSSPASVFHLTNTTPPTVAQCALAVCQALDFNPPVFVDAKAALTDIDREIAQELGFFTTYCYADKKFDRSRSNAALNSSQAGNFPLDEKILAPYVHWYHQFLSHSSQFQHYRQSGRSAIF